MTLLERLGGRETVTAGIVEEFLKLSAAPHPSRYEEAVSTLMMDRLRALGLAPVRDAWYNVKAEVPAAPGLEGLPLLALQGHLDMVCAAAPGFDPLRDAVQAEVSDGVLHSGGRSSLGADNMLGNAAVLWLLGRVLRHGPLRLLFTAAEEVGLEGAGKMDPAWLDGAAALFNTDGFKLGRAVVGAAGGRRETYRRPLETGPAPAGEPVTAALTGGIGGHSGDDIHRSRANAAALMGRFLSELRTALPDFALAELEAGQAHNAIPGSACARLVLPQGGGAVLDALAAEFQRRLAAEFHRTDPALTLRWAPAPAPDRVWSTPCREGTIELLRNLFCGVYAMRTDFPQVVGASANLGRVSVEEGAIQVCAFLRCARREDEAMLAEKHDRTAAAAGFSLAGCTGYPGWPGTPDNPLVRCMDRVFRRETGRALEITAVHVGLEPSIFAEKRPGLPMVVSGPDILDAHSLSERAPLAGLPDYALLLAGTMEAIAELSVDSASLD